ncbi:MAG: DNA recombination protein RmuC [Treponema sp.]|nr:DNA recombination protein RmuC [Treponema sp.]
MDIGFIILITVVLAVIMEIITLIIVLSKQNSGSGGQVVQKFNEFEKTLDKSEYTVREEFARNRVETNRSAKESREELASSVKSLEEKLLSMNIKFTKLIDNKIEVLTKDTKDSLEMNRQTVEKKLTDIQKENGEKLEQMRQTVDEKLHKTLEARLGESFKLVSERLELVHKSIGEMQSLASDVGDLKKVMTNVKTKGVLGEYQLASILEQLLAPHQYGINVKTKAGSDKNVEFAVKFPGKDNPGEFVWLPIDSKLPASGYETLLDAYNSGDKKNIDEARKAFSRTVKNFAKDIRDKYIDPPNTTDFAIMFLPFESEYAEVVRDPELFESIQRDYKINITGPSTISAFLNALQVGFRSIAVEKRTSEIWKILSEIKKEFGTFETVLVKVKEQIDKASTTLEKDVGIRTRAINKKLKDVESLPDTNAGRELLPDNSYSGDEFELN